MNKKAALQLSINAIVVLILAITILGLGIGFIRTQFGGLTEQFVEVRQEIKDQLISKIRDSGDLLVFNRAQLDVKLGQKQDFFIGVKAGQNQDPDQSKLCYRMGVRCIDALRPNNFCDPNSQSLLPVTVGGQTLDFGQWSTPNPDLTWFQLFDEVDIPNNQIEVFPITVQISAAQPDTYIMEFLVWEGDRDKASGCSGTWQETPYQSKQFFVVVT